MLNESSSDLGLDVCDNCVYALDCHPVQVEIIRTESVIWDDDVSMFLSWLNELFESWLGLCLVCFQ